MNKIEDKKMTFFTVFLLGINGIIGSGIFLLSGKIYNDIGPLSIFTIIAAALAVTMIVLCYATLASKFSEDGAAWLYAYNAFGKFTGFQVGIFTWILGVVTLSAEIAALLTVLKILFPALQQTLIYDVSAIALVIILGIINYFGTAILDFADNLSSAAKVFIMLLFIIVGAFFIKGAHFTPMIPTDIHSNTQLFTKFNTAFGVIFYMYTGFSFLPIAAAKMDNPEKNIPKALLSVIATVTLLYVLLQTVAVGILGPNLGSYSLPIAAAFKSIFGQWGYMIIIIGMLISILGVAISVSFNTPIVAASLANEHQLLPKLIGKQSKHNTPVIAIIVTSITSILLLLSGSYLFLVSCIVFASFVQYVPTILATFKFNNDPNLPKGFKLPGGPIIPSLALIVSLYLLLSFNWKIILFGVIVLVLGCLLYWFDNRKK